MQFHSTGRVRILLAAALATVLWLIAPPLQASAEKATAETVRIGYYENEVFQEGARPDAARSGYAYEYYLKIAEYAGWKYEYVYGPFGELYGRLLKGEIDMLAGLARTEERAGRIGYPDDPMGEVAYVLVKRQNDSRISSDPASLAGMRIGTVEGAAASKLEAWLARNGVTARIERFSDIVALHRAFDADGLDALASAVGLEAITSEDGGASRRPHAEALLELGDAKYYLCTAARRPDLLAKLNDAQKRLQTEDPLWLSLLRKKYYLSSLASIAPSAQEKAWLASHRTLCVGCLAGYLPYSGTDAKGQATGMVRDLVPRMLERLGANGLETSFKVYASYSDMLRGLAAGEIDVAFPVGGEPYWAEKSGIRQSNPATSPATALVYRSRDAGEKPRTFAVNAANDMQIHYVLAHFPQAQLLRLPSIEDCLQAVLAGKADATTLNGLRAGELLSNSRFSKLSSRQLPHADPRRFGVRMGEEGLLRMLNRGLALAGDSWIQSLAVRHSGALHAYTLEDIVKACAGVLAFCAVVATAFAAVFFARGARRSKRDAERLSAALAETERASRAKTDFLNGISHDIRTPMNAIVGFATLAETRLGDMGQVRDCLSKIALSSRHLLSLINNVLDMSRIESGRAELEKAELSLPDLLRDLRSVIFDSASAKGVYLSFDADIAHEVVLADRLRLSQVLLNLLSNAVKFTPKGGRIRFSIAEQPSSEPDKADFRFLVKDNGIGMSPEFAKTVFDSFTRERTSTASGIQGTGLGMAISKRLANMMGGTIDVESREGEGSEFTVVLPLETRGAPAGPDLLPALQDGRALVAGGLAFRRSACASLRRLGMRPEEAETISGAASLAAEGLKGDDPFLLAIVDWDAPAMDGAETVRAIRQALGGASLPLVASGWRDDAAQAADAGADAFSPKPLTASGLGRAMEERSAEGRDAGPAAGDEAPRFAGVRILLAEDNEFNQTIALELLGDAGFEIDVACNGVEAVEKVAQAPAGWYGVVLMDIQMPRMDGCEAARRIRALPDPAKAAVPIVAVTANAFVEDRKTALESGMDGHLAKPYNLPAMLATISDLLERGPHRKASSIA